MKTILNYRLTLIGLAVGAMGGYLYYYFIGCATGSCPITTQPLNSTLYGALLGGLAFSGGRNEKPK